ncbi:MAG TPA: thiamine pyrophosphate-dependent enzyme [Thermoanaerobaculia bacterium]|nr:thiamine pyrophosphate-dependent enzyme [Thermoanaerobaculia bacterium]
MSLPETQTRTQFTRESIIDDYRVAVRSRQASLIGRREVLTGKAKFGIFGDGKEVAQLAWARAFRKGDWRSGYYRDQTLMLALGCATLEEFFAQLYADADIEHDPWSGGRSMNAHFASRLLNPDGTWKSQTDAYNISADLSPTGSQMPRLVGLAWASRLYRELGLDAPQFSRNGDEIAWGTIGNASCAEGMFWESLNAGGVLGIPMVVSIWDDGFGISVPNEYQITKGNLSELLKGFQRDPKSKQGYDIYTVKAWDYPALCETYLAAATIVRMEHVPAILHVTEVTQPQGHSTSGSHERYKSKERLEWEVEYDCIRRMREWMIAQGIATAQELDALEKEDARLVREAQRRAWDAYRAPIDAEVKEALALLDDLGAQDAKNELQRNQAPFRRDAVRAVWSAATPVAAVDPVSQRRLASPHSTAFAWLRTKLAEGDQRYGAHLYSEGAEAALKVEETPAEYAQDAPTLNGFEIINHCFDHALRRDPRLIIFGEDVGKLGDVNQGCMGLQEKYGVWRVMDTGIRECTIAGQAIGAALRGFRPIAEIQYLDYLLYALQILSDDLATLRWRSAGGQKAPVIIRTRGHRLEGIWHSGSPMSGIINLLRGMYVCVPRNMTQAAGFYNTLLRSDDPAIVIEVLNGYRTKEKLPSNIAEFTLPLGVPEIIREGSDVTLVSYGATLRIVQEAAELLAQSGIDCEVIDVQTLVPFDRRGVIVESLKKTSRIAFIDEDVPGGASAYMLQQVLERDRGYEWLDSEPRTIPGKEHRPSYGSDGDYWSKPNRETIFAAVYELMREAMPAKYPPIL